MPGIRFGLIGAGLMGKLHAANIVRHSPSAHLAAISDVSPRACANLVARSPVEGVYEDYRRMLAIADVHAVVIATPPELHAEMIEAAARQGKHIFCEKPIDVDVARIERALEAVRAAGVKLQVGFNRRFDINFRRARERVGRGEIGTPLTLHVVSRDPVRRPGEVPQFKPEMFLDTAIHDFDIVRFLSGSKVRSVYAMGQPGPNDSASPHTAVTVLTLEGGATAMIDNSWVSDYGYDQRLEVFGTGGVLRVESNDDSSSAPERAPFFVRRYFDSYVAEMEAFIDCVRCDTEPQVTGADGRAAVLLALAARRSWLEGRPVAMSESG